MFEIRELAVEVGGRRVLNDASFLLRAGDKVGLVGRNGAGKTSMLTVLAGRALPAEGKILRRGKVGYVPQDPRIDGVSEETTALSHILSGRGLDAAAARLEESRVALLTDHSAPALERYSQAEEAYQATGGYSGESEARRIAAGLMVNPDRLELPLNVLSGGERRRVELGRVLFSHAPTLLLDEPTNHLDVDAKAWLMSFLRSYRGAILVVSHDLELLDEAITRVLHLDEGTLVEYRGTYTQYVGARRLDEERLAKSAVRQQAEIKRLSSLADSMRHQTSKRARTAKSLDKRVERLRDVAIEGPRGERKVAPRFPAPPHCGNRVMGARGLSKAYGGPPVFRDVEFDLQKGQRLLILGENGAGKTSLLRILVGILEPSEGTVTLGSGVSRGYYAQEHEGIRAGVPVINHMQEMAGLPERQLRAILGMFGLTGDKATQDAGTLSGGEKTRLALSQLVAGRHNLLLLDEPTNNLDPSSRTAVAEALAAWPGSMVIVSHDTEFVERLEPDRVLLMPDGILDQWSDTLLELVALA